MKKGSQSKKKQVHPQQINSMHKYLNKIDNNSKTTTQNNGNIETGTTINDQSNIIQNNQIQQYDEEVDIMKTPTITQPYKESHTNATSKPQEEDSEDDDDNGKARKKAKLDNNNNSNTIENMDVEQTEIQIMISQNKRHAKDAIMNKTVQKMSAMQENNKAVVPDIQSSDWKEVFNGGIVYTKNNKECLYGSIADNMSIKDPRNEIVRDKSHQLSEEERNVIKGQFIEDIDLLKKIHSITGVLRDSCYIHYRSDALKPGLTKTGSANNSGANNMDSMRKILGCEDDDRSQTRDPLKTFVTCPLVSRKYVATFLRPPRQYNTRISETSVVSVQERACVNDEKCIANVMYGFTLMEFLLPMEYNAWRKKLYAQYPSEIRNFCILCNRSIVNDFLASVSQTPPDESIDIITPNHRYDCTSPFEYSIEKCISYPYIRCGIAPYYFLTFNVSDYRVEMNPVTKEKYIVETIPYPNRPYQEHFF